MTNRTGLCCICVGAFGPVLLLVGGGFLTSTTFDGLFLFLKSYGIGLFFPGSLLLCAALWLENKKGLLLNILGFLCILPGAVSFAAIMFKFPNWLNIFTIGQGITWPIFLMFGIGLILRKKITTQCIGPAIAVR